MVSKRAELRLLIDCYKFYYERINKMENSHVKMNDNREVMIYKFIEKFKEATCSPVVQEVALNKYVEYQFNQYLNNGSSCGTLSIRLEWIYSASGLERWKKVDKGKASFSVRKNLKAKVNIVRETKPTKDVFNRLYLETNENEERSKERFLNTDIGFESCFLTTTLYNHKSSVCLLCDFSSSCKEALKKTYPKIYEIRKYG